MVPTVRTERGRGFTVPLAGQRLSEARLDEAGRRRRVAERGEEAGEAQPSPAAPPGGRA